jgi:hypothetical protein
VIFKETLEVALTPSGLVLEIVANSDMVRLTPTMKCKIREAFGDLHPAQEMPPPRKKVDLQQWTQTAVAQKKANPSLVPPLLLLRHGRRGSDGQPDLGPRMQAPTSA